MATVIFTKTMIDGTGREPVQNAALVIEDGIISQVGSKDQVSFNSNEDQVIDGYDGVLMPGLMDVHCHIFHATGSTEIKKIPASNFTPANTIELVMNGLEGAKLWLSHGVTTLRNVSNCFNFDIGLRELINQGKAIGPRVFAAGRTIAIPERPVYNRLTHGVTCAADARRAAREQLRAGADVIKLFSSAGVGGAYGKMIGSVGWDQLTVEEMQAAVFEAHKAGRTATTHAINTQSIKNALEAGVDSVEHASFLDEECVAMMKERDVVMVPTLFVSEMLTKGTEYGYPKSMEEHAHATVKASRISVTMARESGIRIAVGTDPGHGETIADECFTLHKAGLSAMDVIVSATRIGSEVVGMQDHLGTLEQGKIADMIILAKNPLDNIEAIRNVQWVIKEGKIVKSPENSNGA
jgi:imidazolonepropionase-like amidohydrolase